MFEHEGKERTFGENAALAVALSGVAGAVNATGFFAVGIYTSHVTGHIARVGDELAQGNHQVAEQFFSLILAFLFGAMTATVLVELARRIRGRAKYRTALMVEGGILAFVGIAAGFSLLPQMFLTALLCFAMGLQNALVTKISGAVVRTTHLTGITTDFGIEVVRLVFWFRDKVRGMGLVGMVRTLRHSIADSELHKAWLHFAIFTSFTAGAFAGPFLYVRVGHFSMLLPCATLFGIVAFDDFLRRRHAAREGIAGASGAGEAAEVSLAVATATGAGPAPTPAEAAASARPIG